MENIYTLKLKCILTKNYLKEGFIFTKYQKYVTITKQFDKIHFIDNKSIEDSVLELFNLDKNKNKLDANDIGIYISEAKIVELNFRVFRLRFNLLDLKLFNTFFTAEYKKDQYEDFICGVLVLLANYDYNKNMYVHDRIFLGRFESTGEFSRKYLVKDEGLISYFDSELDKYIESKYGCYSYYDTGFDRYKYYIFK